MQIIDNALTISVVIPAFNVERYIEKAIKSVTAQPKVTEVVVVDDGSTDDTKKIIQRLSSENDKIKYHQHKGGVNKGRAATRNLGIQKSTARYIAFLDADDFYLPNRFTKDLEILKDTSIDGSYNAVGFEFYREPQSDEKKHFKISTLSKAVAPELLFENIVTSKLGYLHLNGLTVKREVFENVGMMNSRLKVAEDSDIIFKLALKNRLVASQIEQLTAKRGIHNSNVFNDSTAYKKYIIILFQELTDWALQNNMSIKKIDLLLNALWIHIFRLERSLWEDTVYWFCFFTSRPRLLFTILTVKYMPLVRKRKMFLSPLKKRD